MTDEKFIHTIINGALALSAHLSTGESLLLKTNKYEGLQAFYGHEFEIVESELMRERPGPLIDGLVFLVHISVFGGLDEGESTQNSKRISLISDDLLRKLCLSWIEQERWNILGQEPLNPDYPPLSED